MHATIFSGAIFGVEGLCVEVEVDLARGIPSFTIVGLPNTAVRESRERVTAAIKNAGLDFPLQRITVNLAPADIKKEGAAFDLAIAMGIILAHARDDDAPEAGDKGALGRMLFLGELALNGSLRPVRGVLPVLLHAKACGFDCAIIPRDNFAEARAVGGIEVYAVSHLIDVLEIVRGRGIDLDIELPDGYTPLEPVLHTPAGVSPQIVPADTAETSVLDMADVRGQEGAKRAMLVAAAGGHHLLMVGPPGAGKTMLARRFPSLLPPLDEPAALETTMIYSIAGLLDGQGLVTRSPFRSPHHSASDAGLIGGGNIPRPGEVTLAHNGVLFMDELPEFRRHALETLREPIEEGRIVISRARHAVAFPARFQLIAAMNPCPCGNRGSAQICHCTPLQVQKYLGKISGPLLDRIAIHMFVRPVDLDAFEGKATGASSEGLRNGVLRARDVQRRRLKEDPFVLNARLPERLMRRFCRLDTDATTLLRDAQKKLRISARGRSHILRVARTIADLDGASAIRASHVGEAIQYRMRELPV